MAAAVVKDGQVEDPTRLAGREPDGGLVTSASQLRVTMRLVQNSELAERAVVAGIILASLKVYLDGGGEKRINVGEIVRGGRGEAVVRRRFGDVGTVGVFGAFGVLRTATQRGEREEA